MTREDALAPVVDAAVKGTGFSREQVLSFFADWDVYPVMVGEEHAATAVLKGTEIHFALATPWGHKGTRGRIQEFLAPKLEKLGFLTTRVLRGNELEASFVCRLGFVLTWSDATFDYYMLAHVPFKKEPR